MSHTNRTKNLPFREHIRWYPAAHI